MASEAAKKGPNNISNMHMDKQVIEVTDFKSEVRFDLGGCSALRGCQKRPKPYKQYAHVYFSDVIIGCSLAELRRGSCVRKNVRGMWIAKYAMMRWDNVSVLNVYAETKGANIKSIKERQKDVITDN